MEHTVEIVIDQLVADEEFRDSFLRNPRRTLGLADEWGLPLSTTEVHALVATMPAVWDRVADEVDARLKMAA
jgi:hypothetical protein